MKARILTMIHSFVIVVVVIPGGCRLGTEQPLFTIRDLGLSSPEVG